MTAPLTALPCPPWCDLPAGHGFDLFDPADGTLERSHWASVAVLDWPREVDRGVDPSAHDRVENAVARTAVAISVALVESAAGDDGPVVKDHRPGIVLDAAGGDLTGPQACQVAAALLNAADLWHRAEAVRQP